MKINNLIMILGDQLDRHSSALDDFDARCDQIFMAEVREESAHSLDAGGTSATTSWSHKTRTALFFSAMRHFAAELEAKNLPVRYLRLGEHAYIGLAQALDAALAEFKPARLICVKPGDYRVRALLMASCARAQVEYCERLDRHFICSDAEFQDWSRGRKEFRLEHFYRHLRKQHGMLMDGAKPSGGEWNYDKENRGSFAASGPGSLVKPLAFAPDAITQSVLEMVQHEFAEHPGSLAHFDWPVTPEQAEAALQEFIALRLCAFGEYQDAMWINEPYLYHSRISAALNMKLLDPRKVCQQVEASYRAGRVSIAAAEGFIRQVLGWREFVRGLYWMHMPAYLEDNALAALEPLPALYWNANTSMRCLQQTVQQTLDFGYAHHIQRLMVTGLFALLLGVDPKQLHAWYLSVYVDAVEWAELPNTIGMSQYADNGLMASKPYCASGKYIERMSNYCSNCSYRPELAVDSTVGAQRACPFTTLYWDFLQRHQQKFSKHPRAALQWRSLTRLSAEKIEAIQLQAQTLRTALRAGQKI